MLKEPGSRLTRDEKLLKISQGDKKLAVVSPLSGMVTCLNHAIGEDPSILHDDPYGKGWICSIRPSDWMAEVTGFAVAEGATDWLRKELERIRDFRRVLPAEQKMKLPPFICRTEENLLTIYCQPLILKNGTGSRKNSLNNLPDHNRLISGSQGIFVHCRKITHSLRSIAHLRETGHRELLSGQMAR